MRFKVQTVPPLPELKAWFSFDKNENIHAIVDIKDALCKRLTILRDECLTEGDISLVLDDFDLLVDSPVGIIRDGDLICIKHSSTAPQKRSKPPSGQMSPPNAYSESLRKNLKRTAGVNGAPPPRKKARIDASSSSSLETTSDDSDSEPSNTSSSSDSSSSSEADSESDSSSTSLPARSASQPARLSSHSAATSQNAKFRPSAPPIPPGQGKASTHSRNLRRRRKRQFERNPPPPEGSSPANLQTLGSKRLIEESFTPEEDKIPSTSDIMMSSLRNKNKKKGFKLSMSRPLPQKIVFSSVVEDINITTKDITLTQTGLENPVPAADVTPISSVPALRVVAPSERGQLPPNIFVTSVDVEEAMSKKKKRKGKSSSLVNNDQWGNESTEVSLLDYGTDPANVESTQLDVPVGLVDVDIKADVTTPDFEDIESRWDSFSDVTDVLALRRGAIVGWKALDINPTTFTPEVLVHLAEVVSADAGAIRIRIILRGSAAETLLYDMGDGEETAEEVHRPHDVLSMGWRIVEL